MAKTQGQDFIPVHIFPINFKNAKSEDYLKKYLTSFSENTAFESKMKNAYYYFEKYRQIPIVLVNQKGEYINDDEALPKPVVKPEKKVYVRKNRTYTDFDEKTIPTTVNNLPVYPEGNEAFKEFLDKLSRDLAVYLPEGRKSIFVLIEFIVDKQGNVLNPKILRGGYDEVNDHILDAFESMPRWKPAVRQEVNVPIKLKQTVVIEGK